MKSHAYGIKGHPAERIRSEHVRQYPLTKDGNVDEWAAVMIKQHEDLT